MNRLLIRLAAIMLLAAPASAWAQGLLVVVDPHESVRLPRPPHIWPHPIPHPVPPPASYKIKELDVQARLTDQIAQVQVSQMFVNTGGRAMEVAFVFPLPYDGAIEQMTLLVDGREYPAKLLDADEARRLYEEIVRKNRDPALLEWMGAGLFRTSVFPVPAGASRTVSLRYSQLCRLQDGLTDFLFPLSTAKYTSEAVEKVSIRVSIESREAIKNVYSPTHAVEIKRPDDRHATVAFTGKNEIPGGDFRLFYDVGKDRIGARVLSYRPDASQDGYLLLLASPEIYGAQPPSAVSDDHSRPRAAGLQDTQPGAAGLHHPAKTVLFVLDRSGSMSGKKIEQVKAALKHVLINLRPGDLFIIVAYDSNVESFRPELQRFDEETRKAALGYVEGLYAGGSTNIDGALRAALGQLQDAKRPNYVLFLTDGLPTTGETNEMKIAADAKSQNRVRARIFSFGVGYDVNSRLLDKLSRENFGQSEFVRPDEDIEDRIAKLYHRIESPVMTDVKLAFVFDEVKTEEGGPVNRLYPKDSFDLFAGQQLAVVGRYRKPGAVKVVVQGMVGETSQAFDFPAVLAEKSNDESLAFIEKLWAVRRVGEILDELDLKGKNDELVKELVDLAVRHGILTPYTSFMADDRANIHDTAGNAARAGGRLMELGTSSGYGGFVQREMKAHLQQAGQAPASAAAPMKAMMADGAGRTDGLSFAREASREADAAERNVRNVGNRTFFRRNGQWVDSQVTREQEINARRVKQYSDEYFELARTQGRRLSPYLVFDEPVLVNLDNQAYLIEP